MFHVKYVVPRVDKVFDQLHRCVPNNTWQMSVQKNKIDHTMSFERIRF